MSVSDPVLEAKALRMKLFKERRNRLMNRGGPSENSIPMDNTMFRPASENTLQGNSSESMEYQVAEVNNIELDKYEMAEQYCQMEWEDYEFKDSKFDTILEDQSSNLLDVSQMHFQKMQLRMTTNLKGVGSGLKSVTDMNRIKEGATKFSKVSVNKLAEGLKDITDINNIKEVFKNMDKKMLNLFADENEIDFNNNFGSAQDYKEKYLAKYGVSFGVPSVYVQNAVWYPKNKSYFVQIVNYVIPDSDEYEVYTHEIGGLAPPPKRFDEIFAEKIKGCCIRLLRAEQDLNRVVTINEHFFDESPRLDKLDVVFSNDGIYMVLYSKENLFIRVVKCANILNLISNIKACSNEIKVEQPMEEITFGNNCSYMIVRYIAKLEIYDLAKMLSKKNYQPREVEISDYMERICDFFFWSNKVDLTYKCYLACKAYNHKKIKVFNIDQLNERDQASIWFTESNSINFFEDICDNFMVKMDVDLEAGIIDTVFVNGTEEFTIQMNENTKETYQMKLTQIGSMSTIHIFYHKNEPYLIACNSYDSHLNIFKADDPDYMISIKRDVQPGIIKIFDACISDEGYLRVLSLRDDEFIVDEVQKKHVHSNHKVEMMMHRQAVREEIHVEEEDNSQQHSYIFSSVRAFSINWPYTCFSGLENNFLLIVNVFDRKQLHRVQVHTDKSVQICQTFISNTKDLFVVIRTEGFFQIKMLDLDAINKGENDEVFEESYCFQIIYEYPRKKGLGNLTNLFARGNSRKEVIKLNQKLLIFLLHGDDLFAWTEGGGSDLIQINPSSMKVTSHELIIEDENTFYFKQRSKDGYQSNSEIFKLNISFADYIPSLILSDYSQLCDYADFKIDSAYGMMLIFTKWPNSDGSFKLRIKILELSNTENIVLDCEIQEEQMKGIFMSGQYRLVDGHIYFNNHVIKLRYDLMKAYGQNGTNQEIYFNTYLDILTLEPGESIKTNSPLDSMQSHKFGFIILNNQVFQPKKLLILPYLHERKVYLNRMKANTDYFYTTKQLQVTKTDEDDEEELHTISIIFSFNITESKFYVYSEKGLLIKRIDFSSLVKQHGKIVCSSSDGLNFILYNQRQDAATVIRFNENSVNILKTFIVRQVIKDFVKRQSSSEFDLVRNSEHWFNKSKTTLLNYSFRLNNKGDIMIRIAQMRGLNWAHFGHSCVNSNMDEVLYYFHANFKVNKNQSFELDKDFGIQCKKDLLAQKGNPQFKKLKGQNLIIMQKKKSFTINQDRIFFWDKHQIEHYGFYKRFDVENRKQLKFKISAKEKFSFIKNVLTCDYSDTLAIVVSQVQCSQIISWSLSQDVENNAFEVQKNYKIIWDQSGSFLILTEDQTTLPVQNCSLKCFQINKFNKMDKTVASKGLGYHNGMRFDCENHNWIILKQYICLSFSYMSFVIQDKIEKIDANKKQDPLLDSAFDLEAFTYMLNKNSCFTSGDLAKDNFMKLQIVLNKLKEFGVDYLEILHYHIEEKVEEEEDLHVKLIGGMKNLIVGEDKSNVIYKSALHQAYNSGNNRVVDIILANMALIKINNSEVFKQVLPDLIDSQNFMTYIENLPSQTFQMQEKKVLRIRKDLSETIVAIAPSHSAYIDDDFYSQKFGEQKHNQKFKSFPVQIVSLPIAWIINTSEGKEFLQAILSSDRLDFYQIKSIQIIIEFLYQQCKLLLLIYLLPLHLIQGGFFVATIFFQELKDKEMHGIETGYHLESVQALASLTISVNQIMTFLMIGIMVRVAMFTGRTFFLRVFTWFDILFYTLNTIANQYALLSKDMEHIKTQRILQAFAIIFFFTKNLYFMKLVDQIAPLIDILIQVILDIKWFLFIFSACLAAFGFAFYLLGANQIDFDDLTDEDKDSIQYQTLASAFMFMWDTCLGEIGTDAFDLGNASQQKFLFTLNVFAQFILLIHLLNMLIAIMGDTFQKRNQVAEQIKIRDHLAFVIDNWYLKNYALRDIKEIKYVITAFHVVEHEEENQILETIQQVKSEIIHKMESNKEEVAKKYRQQDQWLRRLEKNQKMQVQHQQRQDVKLDKIIQKI